MELEYKSIATKGIVDVDRDNGIITTIVAVTGIEDNVKDIIEPGAFTKSMEKRTPKGVWSHDWKIPVSKTLEMKELHPGDPELPDTLANGNPWPNSAGAVMVKTQFNLGTPEGQSAFSNVQFYDDEQEWSIGYQVPQGASYKDSKGVRHIKSMEWYEYSPVLFGAMSHARSVKDAAHDQLVSIKSLLGHDDFYNELKSIVDDDLELDYAGDEDDDEDDDLEDFEDDEMEDEDDEMGAKSLQRIISSLERRGFDDIVELKQAVGSLEIASRNGDLSLTNEFAEDVLDIIENRIGDSETYVVDLVQLSQRTAELSREAEVVRFYGDDEDDDGDYEDWDDEYDLDDEYDEDDDEDDLDDEDDDEDEDILVFEEDDLLDDIEDDTDEEKGFLRVDATEFKSLLLGM